MVSTVNAVRATNQISPLMTSDSPMEHVKVPPKIRREEITVVTGTTTTTSTSILLVGIDKKLYNVLNVEALIIIVL